MSGGFRELIVWQQSMDLVDAIYQATSEFPRSEDYALKSQMPRAAVSIPSNIAEGSGRTSTKEFQHFLRIARGSARELETQIEIAHRVHFMPSEIAITLQAQLLSVNRLLSGLLNSLDRERAN